MKSLQSLRFENRFARLGEAFSTPTDPTPVSSPYLVSYNEVVGALLDLPADAGTSPDFIETFSGNRLLPGFESIAQVYSGHQFGHFVPELGDGRALTLGTVINEDGEHWELNLKGGGLTPYSRDGDGRAVLRSSIREYLASEHMHALGIPTTRALCITGTDDEVYRERIETGALVLRMAPSFIRFGQFEFFYHHRRWDALKQLADFSIAQDFPELLNEPEPYLAWYGEVVARTARLMALWQIHGFNHGVMNTDNFSILGLTLDYGPYGFLDAFDAGHVCNHSDFQGRYAFDQQAGIGHWNLQRLADALTPILDRKKSAEALEAYEGIYIATYIAGMRERLGLELAEQDDPHLILGLLQILQNNKVDYILFLRRLCYFEPDSPNDALRDMFLTREDFDAWAEKYTHRLQREERSTADRQTDMLGKNPKYTLRNYMAELAIKKAEEEKDYSEVNRLLRILSQPFDEWPEDEEYAGHPPAWADRIEVSCSS